MSCSLQGSWTRTFKPSNANNSMILLLRFLTDFKTLIDLYAVSKFFYNYKEVALHKVKLSKTLHIDLAS